MTQAKDSGASQPREGYWFNLKKLRVEHGLLAPAPDRVGPFDTAEEAEKALELLRKRSAAWDEEDSESDR